MASAAYQPLPTYPPSSSLPAHGPPYPLKPTSARLTLLTGLKYLIGTSAALLVLHYVLIGAFPSSAYSARFQSSSSHRYTAAAALADDVLSRLDPSAGQPGTFFRDSQPIKTALAFLHLAEREVEARGLDTCKDQLGEALIDAYHSSELAYCLPEGEGLDVDGAFEPTALHLYLPSNATPPSRISCTPVHHAAFSKWWPYPAAPCFSTNLRTIAGEERKFRAVGCAVTEKGKALGREMGRERYLGSEVVLEPLSGVECTERVERTVMVIGRQDQWNPFHVAEDLITTVVTMLIAAQTAPSLVETRLQLVFAEGYGMDTNHFTPLWDRMGAWAPRRLSLDPWAEGVCLTNTIHSVGAGASLLSAMGVGKSYTCASTITWAAAHYYRHLFGLLPASLSRPTPSLASRSRSRSRGRRPINVLWLSRAKLDAQAQKLNDNSPWRDVRHIDNEPALVARLRAGLSSLCDSPAAFTTGCVFQDAQDEPEAWGLTSPESVGDGTLLPVRFATLDPTVHALETQIHFVGHATILVSSHGGALGLSLFLPPGDAAILELQVDAVRGNFHFEHMAKEMGHGYEMLQTEKIVDVDRVWEVVHRWVKDVAESG
ncbi:hypothetical protein P7C73_g6260, partial [Tremellales sp. Uapishka_1]